MCLKQQAETQHILVLCTATAKIFHKVIFIFKLFLEKVDNRNKSLHANFVLYLFYFSFYYLNTKTAHKTSVKPDINPTVTGFLAAYLLVICSECAIT